MGCVVGGGCVRRAGAGAGSGRRAGADRRAGAVAPCPSPAPPTAMSRLSTRRIRARSCGCATRRAAPPPRSWSQSSSARRSTDLPTGRGSPPRSRPRWRAERRPTTRSFRPPGSATSRRSTARSRASASATRRFSFGRPRPAKYSPRPLAAPSLAAQVDAVANVNPFYAALRDDAIAARAAGRPARHRHARPAAAGSRQGPRDPGRCRQRAADDARGRQGRRHDEGDRRQARLRRLRCSPGRSGT